MMIKHGQEWKENVRIIGLSIDENPEVAEFHVL